jgi:hypothetical protein
MKKILRIPPKDCASCDWSAFRRCHGFMEAYCFKGMRVIPDEIFYLGAKLSDCRLEAE